MLIKQILLVKMNCFTDKIWLWGYITEMMINNIFGYLIAGITGGKVIWLRF
jgi:hypothetical protein